MEVVATELSICVLHTPTERRSIAHLRQYADFESEYELDPGLAAFETIKDGLGIVMALSLCREAIATIRFIPTGHGLTLTERFWRGMISDAGILGPDSWEVGRLVMAPEHRRSDLLPRCLAMALIELTQHVTVRHFHASCLTRMTRLYRRFGFVPHGVAESRTATQCALIHGRVDDVAVALGVNAQARQAGALRRLKHDEGLQARRGFAAAVR
jgi:N-acyl-L-homoserine lactone synthetase